MNDCEDQKDAKGVGISVGYKRIMRWWLDLVHWCISGDAGGVGAMGASCHQLTCLSRTAADGIGVNTMVVTLWDPGNA